MASDENQDTNYKTSQGIHANIIILKSDTGSRTPEQPNIRCVQWKLRGYNGIPEGKPPILWFKISRHQRN